MAEQLTSSQLTELLAYHHVLDQGPDYFNAPPVMEPEAIKAFVASVKKRRKQD